MKYSFDKFGWYDGDVSDDSKRATKVPPANKDIHFIEGQPRSFWNHSSWENIPYVNYEDYQDIESPAQVPYEVPALNAKLVLHKNGIYGQIMSAIKTADVETNIYWENAQVFRRDSVFVASIAAAVGLSDSQLDDLFIEAGEYNA